MGWTGYVQERKEDKPSLLFGKIYNTGKLQISAKTLELLKERTDGIRKNNK